MHYQLTFDEFTEIPYQAGTIQNINERATVEICVNSTANTGLVLYPREKYEWDDATVYARAKWSDEEAVTIAALPLMKSGGGGGGGSTVTVDVGATVTGLPGTPAQVTNSGTKQNVILEFVIPRGADGSGEGGGGIKEWEASTQYAEGELVLHNNQIYRCTTLHASTAWEDDTDNWVLISDAPVWTAQTTYYEGQLVYHDGELYRVNETFTSGDSFSTANLNAIGAWKILEWAPNTFFQVGTILHYKGQLYRVATGMTTSSTFDDVPLMEDYVVPKWQTGIRYAAENLVQHGGNYYEVTQDFTAGEAFSTYCMELVVIKTWTANTAYSVGDLIVNDNIYYEAVESFTSGSVFSTDGLIVYVYTPVPFTANTIYAAGQLIDNNGTMYKAVQSFKSGNAFSMTCLVAYTPAAWQANTYYYVGDIIEYDGDLYEVIRDFHSGAWFTTAVLESYAPASLTGRQIESCIEEYDNAVGAMENIYTTSVSAVGTWINGRTIFQTTFSTTTPADTTAASVASLAGLNVSKIINIEGIVYDTATDSCYSLNYSDIIKTWASLSYDSIMMAVTDYFNARAYITIRYTK